MNTNTKNNALFLSFTWLSSMLLIWLVTIILPTAKASEPDRNTTYRNDAALNILEALGIPVPVKPGDADSFASLSIWGTEVDAVLTAVETEEGKVAQVLFASLDTLSFAQLIPELTDNPAGSIQFPNIVISILLSNGAAESVAVINKAMFQNSPVLEALQAVYGVGEVPDKLIVSETVTFSGLLNPSAEPEFSAIEQRLALLGLDLPSWIVLEGSVAVGLPQITSQDLSPVNFLAEVISSIHPCEGTGVPVMGLPDQFSDLSLCDVTLGLVFQDGALVATTHATLRGMLGTHARAFEVSSHHPIGGYAGRIDLSGQMLTHWQNPFGLQDTTLTDVSLLLSLGRNPSFIGSAYADFAVADTSMPIRMRFRSDGRVEFSASASDLSRVALEELLARLGLNEIILPNQLERLIGMNLSVVLGEPASLKLEGTAVFDLNGQPARALLSVAYVDDEPQVQAQGLLEQWCVGDRVDADCSNGILLREVALNMDSSGELNVSGTLAGIAVTARITEQSVTLLTRQGQSLSLATLANLVAEQFDRPLFNEHSVPENTTLHDVQLRLQVANVVGGNTALEVVGTVALWGNEVRFVVAANQSAGESQVLAGFGLSEMNLSQLAPAISSHLAEPKNGADLNCVRLTIAQGFTFSTDLLAQEGVRDFFAHGGCAIPASVASGLNFSAKLNPKALALLEGFEIDAPLSLSGQLLGDIFSEKPDFRFSIALPAFSLPGTASGFRVVGDTSAITISHVAGATSAFIATELQVELVGLSLRLTDVILERSTDGLAISGSTSGLSLPLPLPGFVLNDLTLNGQISTSENLEVALSGRVAKANGEVLSLSVEIGKEEPRIRLNGELTFAEISGLDLPMLNVIAVEEVVISASETTATLLFNGNRYDVGLFKGASDKQFNLLLMSEQNLSLASFVAGLANTPLDDMAIAKPVLVYIPEGNSTSSVRLPEMVPLEITQNYTPSHGISLIGTAAVKGEVQSLLDRVGVSPATINNLPLNGTLNSSFLTNPQNLPDLAFTFPIGPIQLPGNPDFLSMANNRLLIAIESGQPRLALLSDVEMIVAGHTHAFAASITVGSDTGGEYLQLEGIASANWNSAFGLAGVNLIKPAFTLRLGEQSGLSLDAETSLVQGLRMSTAISLEKVNGQLQIVNYELSLLDADIPLGELPGVNFLPAVKSLVDKVKMRDIVIANSGPAGRVIAGKASIEGGAYTNALVFQVDGHWNIVIFRQAAGFADIIPLFGNVPILGDFQFSQFALTISSEGIRKPISQLPAAAHASLAQLYGTDTNKRFNLPAGLGLLAAIDPAAQPMGPLKSAFEVLALHDVMTLSGSVSGMFGGTPSIALVANLPGIDIPEIPGFLGLPDEIGTSFYVEFSGTQLGVGLAINAVTPFDPDGPEQEGELVALDSELFFQITPTGGVELGIQSTLLDPWPAALGIQGLTLLPDTRIGFSVNPTGFDMAITGNAEIIVGEGRTKVLSVTGAGGMVGVIPKGGVGGKIDSLTLAEVMGLTNSVVTASGGARIETDFPSARLENVAIGFATAGTALPDYGIGDLGGIHLAGTLFAIRDNPALGSFEGTIQPTGLIARGDIYAFSVGAVSMEDSFLDINATLNPFNPPYFRINGDLTIGEGPKAVRSAGAMNLSLTRWDFQVSQEIGTEFSYTFGAFINGPEGLDLNQVDMGLNGSLTLQPVERWVKGDVLDFVDQTIADLKAESDQLATDLDAAQAEVNRLNILIAAARQRVDDDRKERIDTLQNNLDVVRHDVDEERRLALLALTVALVNAHATVDAQIASLQSHITQLNQQIASLRQAVDDARQQKLRALDSDIANARQKIEQARKNELNAIQKKIDKANSDIKKTKKTISSKATTAYNRCKHIKLKVFRNICIAAEGDKLGIPKLVKDLATYEANKKTAEAAKSTLRTAHRNAPIDAAPTVVAALAARGTEMTRQEATPRDLDDPRIAVLLADRLATETSLAVLTPRDSSPLVVSALTARNAEQQRQADNPRETDLRVVTSRGLLEAELLRQAEIDRDLDDPSIGTLIVARNTALDVLQTSENANDGVNAALLTITRALDGFRTVMDKFSLQYGEVKGSLKQLLAGEAVVLNIRYEVLESDFTSTIVYDPFRPDYTVDQLHLIATEILLTLSRANPDLPASFRTSVLAEHERAEARAGQERDRVLAENGY